jgi:hypothetical protein
MTTKKNWDNFFLGNFGIFSFLVVNIPKKFATEMKKKITPNS